MIKICHAHHIPEEHIKVTAYYLWLKDKIKKDSEYYWYLAISNLKYGWREGDRYISYHKDSRPLTREPEKKVWFPENLHLK